MFSYIILVRKDIIQTYENTVKRRIASMKEKLKIGLVVACNAPIPDVLGGGAERLITLLIEENEKYQRCKFYVYCLANDIAEREALKYKHSKIFYFKTGRPVDKLVNGFVRLCNRICGKHILRKWGYMKNIYKVTQKHGLDLIVDENGYAPEIAYFTNDYGRNRISAHLHMEVNPLEKEIDGLYGSVIGVSKYTVRNWLGHCKYKNVIAKVVYSAVDEKRFCKDLSDEDKRLFRTSLGFSEDDFIVLYCGRLHEQKGIGKLVDSVAYIPDSHIRFLVVGGENLCKEEAGAYQQMTRKRAAKYGDRIIFTGYVDNEKLYQYYAISHIQMIPSICEEAAGLISIEGMYAGLPIIASVSGGLPEYVNDKCALFVERNVDMPKNLAKAVIRLYENEELRTSMSDEAKIQSRNFTKKKYYDDFIHVCYEILKEKGLVEEYGQK